MALQYSVSIRPSSESPRGLRSPSRSRGLRLTSALPFPSSDSKTLIQFQGQGGRCWDCSRAVRSPLPWPERQEDRLTLSRCQKEVSQRPSSQQRCWESSRDGTDPDVETWAPQPCRAGFDIGWHPQKALLVSLLMLTCLLWIPL